MSLYVKDIIEISLYIEMLSKSLKISQNLSKSLEISHVENVEMSKLSKKSLFIKSILHITLVVILQMDHINLDKIILLIIYLNCLVYF